MKIREILKRINGLSTPVFGVSWNPNDLDGDHVRKLISYLEDRRVLYSPSEMEVPRQCIESVLDIRKFLTNQIGIVRDQRLLNMLRGMRATCRKFLDEVGSNDDIVRFGHSQGHWASWVFNGALGELRGVMGIYLAGILTVYNFDVEDRLAAILPTSDE